MYTQNLVDFPSHPNHAQISDSETTILDLSMLVSMAGHVEKVSNQLTQHTFPALPIISSTTGSRERSHRVVIYRPLPTTQQNLQFVGFVSKRHADIPTAILTSLIEVDKMLVMDLARHPGLLNYSSLELADGIWYNLVIFAHTEVKNDILALKTHQFAAYELAPSYYQWIRLHHGILTGERLSTGLTLQKTKYYTFHTLAQPPTIRIQIYDPAVVIE